MANESQLRLGKVWDMLEEQSEGKLSSVQKDELIVELCHTIKSLQSTLDWYGDENHILSTWYDRENTKLCNEATESGLWRRLGGEDDIYVEQGSRAQDTVCDTELPTNIIEKLITKLNQKVNTMQNTAIKTETTTENTHALTKDQWLQAVADFKAFNADKEKNGPWVNSEGTKFKGNLRFMTYIFYAMLRGKDTAKTTHDVESENYKLRMKFLKCFATDKEFSHWVYGTERDLKNELNLVQECFSSLSSDQMKAIIKAAI